MRFTLISYYHVLIGEFGEGGTGDQTMSCLVHAWTRCVLSVDRLRGGNSDGASTMKSEMVEPAVVIDAQVMNGTPCFRGTRVPFKNLIDYLEGGHTLDEFLKQFPTVTREMAIQSLEEAKDSLFAKIE